MITGNIARTLACIVTITWLAKPVFAAEPETGRDLIERGKAFYEALCVRCHGENGDERGYPHIKTLAGLPLRITDPLEAANLSIGFAGKQFNEDEAKALYAYLDTLEGEKQLKRPGYLVSAYLLGLKFAETKRIRALDVRPGEAHRAGRVPYAAHWDLEGIVGDPSGDHGESLEERLGQWGIRPDTFIVVYGENSGPKAAFAWERLQRLGHRRSAVLDGGWEAWVREGATIHRGAATFAPADYAFPEAGEDDFAHEAAGEPIPLHFGGGQSGASYGWTQTTQNGEFKTGPEIAACLNGQGIRAPGAYRFDPSDPLPAAHLALAARLSGLLARVDWEKSQILLDQ